MATDIDTTPRPPTAGEQRRMRAEARADDKLLADTYEQGRQEGRQEGRSEGRGGRRAPSARGVARGARRGARTARRSASSTSPIGLVVLSLGLVLLYGALQSADQVGGFLGGLRRGLAWLTDPHAVIPYGGTQ